MISRKHFQMIADEFKATRPVLITKSPSAAQWEKDVKAVAIALARLNPRFSFSRFYEACGLEVQEEKAA